MNDLKSKLNAHGFDTSTLKSLRDVAVCDSEEEVTQITEREQKYPIYTLKTVFEATPSIWADLRKHINDTGHTPVILGDLESVQRHWESQKSAKMPEVYLTLAQSIDVRDWFTKNYKFAVENFPEEEILGTWREQKSFTTLTASNLSFLSQIKANLYIGLFPTIYHWEVPAYLAFGCWNDCPCPESQVAIHKYWHEHHNSEIVLIKNDFVILKIQKPVTQKDDALSLAKDQMAYCPDNVFQGYETLRASASALLNSTYWGFWWD